MEAFNKEEIDKLSHLCRIACTEEERQLLQDHLKRLLDYFRILGEIDTAEIEPCYRVSETLTNVMREDEAGPCLARETFFANAPLHTGGMIRVPSVIKSSN